MQAQANPADFDGILAGNYPAIHWTRFITAELYPQVVIQRDLGGVAPTHARAGHAGLQRPRSAACDSLVTGQHRGLRAATPPSCRYDPTTGRQAVLCTAERRQQRHRRLPEHRAGAGRQQDLVRP
jgi:hypothetical protein